MMRLRAGPMLVAMTLAGLALPAATGSATERALLLEIDGAIGPPIADYIVRELGAARPGEVRLIILRMNTPGGLDTSMRQIISAILASPVPVATYVAPNGARAASAGTYIACASAIAAMAPSTNIGAATPVQFGGNPLLPSDQKQQKEQKQQEDKPGEPADTETRKVVNDAVAYIRSLAALNGRNGDWAVEAVRSAASLPASEALSLHVIDMIADDVPDLLRKIDGRTVTVAGKQFKKQVRMPYWHAQIVCRLFNSLRIGLKYIELSGGQVYLLATERSAGNDSDTSPSGRGKATCWCPSFGPSGGGVTPGLGGV